MAKKLKPFPAGAICYTGPWRSVPDVHPGDWFVDGAWMPAAEFAKTYELPPEPEPVPEALPSPEPADVPEEIAVESTPEPVPEPQPLIVGPSALDVDQGSMSHN